MKCWSVRFPIKKFYRIVPIYRNKKTGQHITIGNKQLGSFDNFTKEKYPFEVEDSGHPVRNEKWFDNPKEAKAHLKKYMKENC